jgi:UDP-glucose:(heptosyl)LPS alpha-1,3-glucosyltransferase
MACYAAADLLLHPARWENTGGVILEAMVAGLPVVSTANCGFSVHVERAAAGLVVPEPFSQAALDAAVAAALDPGRRTQWSDNARRYVAKTDVHSGQQRAAELIEAIIARAGPHTARRR